MFTGGAVKDCFGQPRVSSCSTGSRNLVLRLASTSGVCSSPAATLSLSLIGVGAVSCARLETGDAVYCIHTPLLTESSHALTWHDKLCTDNTATRKEVKINWILIIIVINGGCREEDSIKNTRLCFKKYWYLTLRINMPDTK
ncbi:hypothetical protein C0Q70_03412 [Pomacea canaliculata]|uniref:Uncharacterized protein n=1 Tax=Pomacea canaliculata TaxID=400727 RepID=A0A2T7PSM5_POMCA|nr:hypothetical protein C0Q70_03412 [Pomacea canaliculata]